MSNTRKHAAVALCISVFGLAAVSTLTGCSAVLDWDSCGQDSDCGAGGTCDTVAALCVGSGAGTLTVSDLLKNGCDRVYGVDLKDALNDDVILVATLLPKTGQQAHAGPPRDDAVAMAIQEINRVGGLFGKKLAALSCDSGTDAAVAEVAAKHLVAVGVPAVIGPAVSSVSIEVFNNVFKAAGVLSMSPSATAPALSDLSDGNLLWRTAPSDAFQGAAMAAFLAASGLSKIALVNRDDAYGNGLAQTLRVGLCAPAGPLDCSDETKFFNRKYDPGAYSIEQAQIVLDLDAFSPDVTVLIAFAEDGVNFLNLTTAPQLNISQRFLVSDGMKSSDIIAKIVEDETLCGLLGTQPAAPSGVNYKAFELNFAATYGGKQPGAFSANAYDAMYLLGYAVAATGGQELTGAVLAEGLGRLSSGDQVDVGPTKWNGSIQKLSSSPSATIDFNGASGPLDFTSKGEAPASIELWVFDLDKTKTQSLGEILGGDEIYSPPKIADPAIPGLGATCAAFRAP